MNLQTILTQGGFQNNQWNNVHDINNYMKSLINKEIPNDLFNRLMDINSQLIVGQNVLNEGYVQAVQELQQQLQQQNIEYGQKINDYSNQHIELLKSLAEARKTEQLNDYDIDIDSQIYVRVIQGIGLPVGQYYVKIECFDEKQQTDVQSYKWEQELIFRTPSPHGQLFIQLIQVQDKLIGQLHLPLYLFKDQQNCQEDYILEDQSGVLGNVKHKLQLIIWWVHSKVALIEDHIQIVDSFKKEIQELKQQINTNNKYQNILKEFFNPAYIQKKKNYDESLQIMQIQEGPIEVQGQQLEQSQMDHQDFEALMQKVAQTINKVIFIIDLEDFINSIDQWQKIVIYMSGFMCLLLILFIMLARPYFQILMLDLSIFTLVWTYQDKYIPTLKILNQIASILFLSQFFEVIWLFVFRNVWNSENHTLFLIHQLDGDRFLNELAYYFTIIQIPLNLIVSACTFNLSLKYNREYTQQLQ
ncbi:hypothetical protein pb186bvf_009341 [Paramecium bursaria]